MNAKRRRVRYAFVGVIILFILACSLPSNPTTSPESKRDFPPTTRAPDTITATQLLLDQNTISPTPTPLDLGPIVNFGAGGTPTEIKVTLTPQLPDFDPIVNFASGGGDAPCLYVPDKSLPAVEGSTAFDQYFLPRTGILCIWGAPFDTRLQVSMISPSGRVTLGGSVQVQSSDSKVIWLDQNLPTSSSLSANLGSTTAIYLSLWWPGQVESGDWRVSVRWDGGAIAGKFFAKTRNNPEVSVIDNRSRGQILPGRCLSTSNGENLRFVGENFPANRTVYVLVYSEAGASASSSLISKQAIQTDDRGAFVGEFNQSLGLGKYFLVGFVDPNIKVAASGGQVNYEAVADAIDCLVIANPAPLPPISAVSSCPGAPPQRIKVNQRGYVCTREDAVKLRGAPKRSGGEIMQLAPGARFTVIGGPSCADNWSWWNVRLDNGTLGWISEGGDQTDPYFICPLN